MKNVSYLLRLRSFRYRQTPNNLQRVKAHALGREPSTLLLVISLFLAISKEQDSADASTFITFLCLCYVTISNLFWGSTYSLRLQK